MLVRYELPWPRIRARFVEEELFCCHSDEGSENVELRLQRQARRARRVRRTDGFEGGSGDLAKP